MAENVAKRGLLLPCPLCGEPDACITLDLDDAETFHCRECDGEFTAQTVKRVIKDWTEVLDWIDTMPTRNQIDDSLDLIR
jgi:hypothetical protein